MSEDFLAYVSVLRLSRTDIKTLNIKDAYGIHKVVFGLFENLRSEEQIKASWPSGISYVDKGGDFNMRQILILSNRRPHQTPQFGVVETKTVRTKFLEYERYGFESRLNPSKRDLKTGKVVSIKGRDDIANWFKERASSSWGFSVIPNTMQVEGIGVQTFSDKKGQIVTHGSATLKGVLEVTDRAQFVKSFIQGIGRGRGFGFGLLQIIPLTSDITRKENSDDSQ